MLFFIVCEMQIWIIFYVYVFVFFVVVVVVPINTHITNCLLLPNKAKPIESKIMPAVRNAYIYMLYYLMYLAVPASSTNNDNINNKCSWIYPFCFIMMIWYIYLYKLQKKKKNNKKETYFHQLYTHRHTHPVSYGTEGTNLYISYLTGVYAFLVRNMKINCM